MSSTWKHTELPEQLDFNITVQIGDGEPIVAGKIVYYREDVVEDIVDKRFAMAREAKLSMDTRCRCVPKSIEQ